MRILITGSAGFIGFHVAKKFLEQNHTVVGIDSLNNFYSTKLKFDRLSILNKLAGFEFIAINICNKDELDELFNTNSFELVVHLAAQAGVRYSIDKPYKYLESNLIGFVNIIEACRVFNVRRLIFASSSSVYGNSLEVPFSLDQSTDRPESLYAATKKANELMAFSYAKMYGIKTFGLRFFTAYGPYGRPDMAYFSFAEKIVNGIPIEVYNHGDMERDFTYIDDIVLGISKLIENFDEINTFYKVYNLGNNKPVRLMDFIKKLEFYLGKKAQFEYLPMQTGDVLKTYADISESQKDFGYEPNTDYNEGLKSFVEWFNEYSKIEIACSHD
jgi:UDP-glucuronate 4-epimerase